MWWARWRWRLAPATQPLPGWPMAALQLPRALLGLVSIGISCFMSSALFFFMSSACLQLSVHKILSSVAWHACSPFHKASLSSFHEQGECVCVVSALLQPGHRSPREDRCSHSGSSSWLVQGSVQSPGQANLSLGAWAEAGPDGEAANGSWRFKLLTTRMLNLRAASPFLCSRLPVSYRWARALFLLPCSPLTNTLSLAGMSLCNPEPHEER